VSETLNRLGVVCAGVLWALLLSSCGGSATSSQSAATYDSDSAVAERGSLRIAFGSCADDDAPDHPVWQSLIDAGADAVILAGDNVYADTPAFQKAPSEEVMRAEYAKFAASPGFAQLRSSVPIFATWDDHDFGANDGGAEFAFKDSAQQIFAEFWQLPADDPVRVRDGVYSERRLRHAGVDVQVLLLDTRYFRGPLLSTARSLSCPIKNYEPNTKDTFLGAAQWRWLEERLQEPADLRLLVSSQQVIPDQHCFEKWGNFPHERQRLFALLKETAASNVLIISGDRHLGEISRLPAGDSESPGFDVYEITASPLSARSGFGWGETNDFRVSTDNLRESQFGVLDINRLPDGVQVSMQLRDQTGGVRFRHHITLPVAP